MDNHSKKVRSYNMSQILRKIPNVKKLFENIFSERI